MFYAGIDIGGTKCAALLGTASRDKPRILSKEKFDTVRGDPGRMLERLAGSLAQQMKASGLRRQDLRGIGISCGGPLDSKKGIILGPPNLDGWDEVPIARFFGDLFHVPVVLKNDADACAVAEWKFGAGRGAESMIFLTFGTGIGAGLILDSRLYSGPDDLAGEVGHIRLTEDGPPGYGKLGSAEGYCSGSGIARMGRTMIGEEQRRGRTPALLKLCGSPEMVSAKAVAELADAGDELCLQIYRTSGEKLGQVLSILVDVLNPDKIIIGSVFTRSRHLLWESCRRVMETECLHTSYRRCEVLPSELGDSIGDYAALYLIIHDRESAGDIKTVSNS